MKLNEIYKDSNPKSKDSGVNLHHLVAPRNNHRTMLGSGREAVVFHRNTPDNVNSVTKIIKPDYAYMNSKKEHPDSILYLIEANTGSMEGNPHVPKVYDIRKIKKGDRMDPTYYKVRMEKLTPWPKLSREQVFSMLSILAPGYYHADEFEVDIDAIEKKLHHIPWSSPEPLDIAYTLAYSVFRDLQLFEGVVSPKYIEAVEMIKTKFKGIMLDIIPSNMMARVTPYGVFMVINDPL